MPAGARLKEVVTRILTDQGSQDEVADDAE
jgi:hypothetical protein